MSENSSFTVMIDFLLFHQQVLCKLCISSFSHAEGFEDVVTHLLLLLGISPLLYFETLAGNLGEVMLHLLIFLEMVSLLILNLVGSVFKSLLVLMTDLMCD